MAAGGLTNCNAESLKEIREKRDKWKQESKVKTAEYWANLKEKSQLKKMNYIEASNIYYKIAQKQIHDFELNDFNKPIMRLLTQYVCDDNSFEYNGFSLKKGIMLVGNIGCGKTTLMKLYSTNQKQSYIVKSARLIANEFSKDGISSLEYYYENIKFAPDSFGRNDYSLCLDDIGTDDIKKHYGESVNPIQDILLTRYDRNIITHGTTNLNAAQLRDMYGDRCFDRMREMFNFITFDINANSLRK
jgi:DNA replication protein DnaC